MSLDQSSYQLDRLMADTYETTLVLLVVALILPFSIAVTRRSDVYKKTFATLLWRSLNVAALLIFESLARQGPWSSQRSCC